MVEIKHLKMNHILVLNKPQGVDMQTNKPNLVDLFDPKGRYR